MSEQLQVPYKSIPDMFLQRVAATPAANAFAYPGPNGPVWLSWKTVGERATAIAAGLHAIGVQPQDRVAIASNTRVEWVLADLGIMCAGAATTTIYPTTEAKDAAFILSDSGVEGAHRRGRQPGRQDRPSADLPNLTHIVVIGRAPRAPRRRRYRCSRWPSWRRRVAACSPPTPISSPASRPGSGRTTSPRSCTPRARPAPPRAWSCCTAAGAGRAWPRASSASSSPTTSSTCGCRCRTRSARRILCGVIARRAADVRRWPHRQDRRRTCPRSSRPSCAARRASTRSSTTASTARCGRPAAPSGRSSSGPSRSASRATPSSCRASSQAVCSRRS